MIYEDKPLNFNPKFEAVGCFIEYEGKMLLLLRQDFKPNGNTWGLPSGKINQKENPKKAVLREIEEETGIELENVNFLKKVYVKYPEYDFIYYIFHAKLDKMPKIKINNSEHKEFIWKYPKDTLNFKVIRDLDNCIKLFYKL